MEFFLDLTVWSWTASEPPEESDSLRKCVQMHVNLFAKCAHMYIAALSCMEQVLLQDVPQAILWGT